MTPPEHPRRSELELTIVMPCLNEAKTLARCIGKAHRFLAEAGVAGEVLVADNGSSDGSPALARQCGARVVGVPERGYGAALAEGIRQARGEFVVMGDADDSYDFLALAPFLQSLRAGNDLVMGNRFLGGIRAGAMSWKNRRIGNPGLSALGRLFFRAPVGDIYCGLRGFRRTAVERMDLRAQGMEFAVEMVVKATALKMRVAEVATTLDRDGRGRPPHLRPWRDGWRTLRFMLLYSPRWLFLYPGVTGVLVGGAVFVRVLFGPWRVGRSYLDVDTLPYASATILIGFQSVLFWIYAQVFAVTEGLRPKDALPAGLSRVFSLERGLAVGAGLFVLGFAGGLLALFEWGRHSFGLMDVEKLLRLVDPSALAMTLGVQIVLSSFFLSLLLLRRR